MRSIRDIDIKGKRVLIRVDFNVPMDDELKISDDIRMQMALPTLEYIKDQGGRLIICSHLGRPGGTRVDSFSMAPVAEHLGRLMRCDVQFAPDCIGKDVEVMADNLEPGGVLLLENLRFHPEETKNDPDFSARLARLGDVYINDAFAVSHRAHASVSGVTEYIEQKGGGFLLQKEMDYFSKAMDKPVRPLVALIGGAKVSSKLGALQNMLDRVDKMIIGGAMANTFLKSQGVDMGGSLVEEDLLDTARAFIEESEKKGVKLYMPFDFVVADSFSAEAVSKCVTFRDIPEGWLALDIGPATTIYFQEALSDARTIVWNGPMGAFEIDQFARGTMALCHAVASSHALSITGGGDSNAAVKKAGESGNISYMSTGGGAFLQLMEGKKLPGVEALK
jgi:phosphoglycerate kinase